MGHHAELELTQAELKEVLRYEPDTGMFFWVKPKCKMRPGDRAGYQKAEGYWAIRVKSVKYFAHRLAWLYVYGQWPSLFIDHINRDRSDNRISNLRDVTHSVNMSNRNRKTVGGVGVRRQGRRWESYCYRSGQFVHLGSFGSREQAEQCSQQARAA